METTIMEVPRGFSFVSAISGVRNGVLHSGSYTCPEQVECDPVYCHNSVVDCRDDTASDTLFLHKQFSLFSIEIRDAPQDPDMSFWIESDFHGIDLFSLSPVKGTYRCETRRVADSTFETRIPRQGKGSIRLFCTPTGLTPAVSFRLDQVLDMTGFDWKKTDLDDLKIVIDFHKRDIFVLIEEWYVPQAIEIVI